MPTSVKNFTYIGLVLKTTNQIDAGVLIVLAINSHTHLQAAKCEIILNIEAS